MDNLCYKTRNELKSNWDINRFIKNFKTQCSIEEKSKDKNEQKSKVIEKPLKITADNITKTSGLKSVIRLPDYLPSEKIQLANDSNFSWYSLRESYGATIKTYLNDLELNENNIHYVLKILLEIEDLTCMSEYVPFVQKNVRLNYNKENGEYWISLNHCANIRDIVVPFVDEIVLVPEDSPLISALMRSEFKTDILLYKERVKSGTVREITNHRACFDIRKNEFCASVKIDETKKYRVIFRPLRIPLRYQHNAIELLHTNAEIRKYLFPTENRYKGWGCIPVKEEILFNKTIASNPEQLSAVQQITQGLNVAPFIIFGPPGTGKTTTTVESILQLHCQNRFNRILVTAGSNAACDTIALRICKYFHTESRLQNLEHINPFIKKNMLRIYSQNIVHKDISSIDELLLKYSNCEKRRHHYPSIAEIREYGIVVATLCTVGKLVTCGLGIGNDFTHIFIDESGASTIPESLVAVMGIKTGTNCRLILSGDHKQLGPVLKSERAAELGLGQSLMELLLKNDCYAVDDICNYDRTLQARLRRNYRSHPEIVRLYNHLFYKNELIAEAKEEIVNLASKWSILPNSKFPIIFQAVHGVTEKDDISPSSFNNLEIEVVMWFLRRLLNDGIDGQKIDQEDIGVITPYKLQTKRIRDRVNNRGWKRVEIGSVENFQGREKQIVIVSLVRSFSGLGFVSNPKRLNVLLSRAQSLLILIGNPLTLRQNTNFDFILDECKKHGTYMRKDKYK